MLTTYRQPLLEVPRREVRLYDRLEQERYEREFAYRPVGRLNVGSAPNEQLSGSPADTPLTILGSSNVLQWVRADLGLTASPFTWLDQSGNSKDYSSATGPSLNSSDSSLNNQATLTYNGTSQFCDSTLSLPAPGTTPTFLWAIFKQNAWTVTRNIFSDSTATRLLIFQQGTTPAIVMADTSQVNSNTGATIGSWFRLSATFTNSTSDVLKIGSTTVTGANAGNNAGGGTRRIATNNTGTTFASISVAELVYAKIVPSASQLNQLDSYVNARYGAGLT